MSIVALLVSLSSPAMADRDAAALRSLDTRLAGIAFRLVTRNAALCRRRAPATGLLLHALGQYPPSRQARVSAAFGFEAPVAVEAVAPGSPAEAAGVAAGDSLVAVDGVAIGTASAPSPTTADRDAALAMIAAGPADSPITLRLRHGGAERSVSLTPVAGCAVTVEGTGAGLAARADAHAIQVGLTLVAGLDDGAVAAVVAHELAHVVFGHHDRLVATGRSPALVRRSEDEADALSPVLLYNAGYDPGAAARLWQSWGALFEGRRGGLHGGAAERAAATAAAAAAIPAGTPRPWRPPGLAQ